MHEKTGRLCQQDRRGLEKTRVEPRMDGKDRVGDGGFLWRNRVRISEIKRVGLP
jgi:hypothetical protein